MNASQRSVEKLYARNLSLLEPAEPRTSSHSRLLLPSNDPLFARKIRYMFKLGAKNSTYFSLTEILFAISLLSISICAFYLFLTNYNIVNCIFSLKDLQLANFNFPKKKKKRKLPRSNNSDCGRGD